MSARRVPAFLRAATVALLLHFGIEASLYAQQIQASPLQLPLQSQRLSTAFRVFVREFRFEGNRVFASSELAKVVAPYVGREIASTELEEARRAVTRYYIEHGYINSGAVFPEQPVDGGVITINITEGVLSDIHVSGNKWLRDSYIKGRLNRWATAPLDMNRLKEGLELLRQDPNVAQVNAQLRPGALPGQSFLDVNVKDRNPFQVGLQVDNGRPPSAGADEILLLASDRNLSGHGDELDVSYGIAEGGNSRTNRTATDAGFKFSDFNDVSASYLLPLTSYGTTLRAYGSKNDYTVIEEPFAALDIMSESYQAGATLRQPFYQTANREFALAVTFERRHSKTFLLGIPFDVNPGSTNGITDISALRIAQEWIDRSQTRVLALRSTFSIGLDAFGISESDPNRNGRFFAWLGQAQYAQRLFNTPCQIILRGDSQLTRDSLLSLEQFTLGGPGSVRGYRVNQLVADEGADASIELRVPVLFNRKGSPVLQLALFSDFGNVWNAVGKPPEPSTLWSVGIGLLYTPNQHVSAQIYWGHPIKKVNTPDNDLQDLGLYFKVNVQAF